MARMTGKGYVRRDALRELLNSTLRHSAGRKFISGRLSVKPGHEYWWFLEFGTGSYHKTPDGILQPPDGIEEDAGPRGPYPINVKDDSKFLVYLTKSGTRRRVKDTMHPGVKPLRGFVRMSVRKAAEDIRLALRAEAARKGKKGQLMLRPDFVRIVNEQLSFLLIRLAAITPSDSDVDPFHDFIRPRTPPLSESWIVNKAK